MATHLVFKNSEPVSPPHRQAVQRVEHRSWRIARDRALAGLVRRPATVAVLGEAGTGKSMLLAELQRVLTAGSIPARLIAADTKLPGGRLADGALADPSVVLLIDDAARLSHEVLPDLVKDQRRLLVLSARPDFASRLDGLSRPAALLRLPPLRSDEIAEFLAASLPQAATKFSDAAIVRLSMRSRGIARLLHELAETAIFLAERDGAARVESRHVDQAAVVGDAGPPPARQTTAPEPLPRVTLVPPPPNLPVAAPLAAEPAVAEPNASAARVPRPKPYVPTVARLTPASISRPVVVPSRPAGQTHSLEPTPVAAPEPPASRPARVAEATAEPAGQEANPAARTPGLAIPESDLRPVSARKAPTRVRAWPWLAGAAAVCGGVAVGLSWPTWRTGRPVHDPVPSTASLPAVSPAASPTLAVPSTSMREAALPPAPTPQTPAPVSPAPAPSMVPIPPVSTSEGAQLAAPSPIAAEPAPQTRSAPTQEVAPARPIPPAPSTTQVTDLERPDSPLAAAPPSTPSSQSADLAKAAPATTGVGPGGPQQQPVPASTSVVRAPSTAAPTTDAMVPSPPPPAPPPVAEAPPLGSEIPAPTTAPTTGTSAQQQAPPVPPPLAEKPPAAPGATAPIGSMKPEPPVPSASPPVAETPATVPVVNPPSPASPPDAETPPPPPPAMASTAGTAPPEPPTSASAPIAADAPAAAPAPAGAPPTPVSPSAEPTASPAVRSGKSPAAASPSALNQLPNATPSGDPAPLRPLLVRPGPDAAAIPGPVVAIPDLPAGALTLVTVRFPAGNDRAARHATALAAMLRHDGFEVADPVPVTAREPAGIRYVFAEDRDAATAIAAAAHRHAGLLPATASQRKVTERASPPRPGAVEVTVTGEGEAS